MYSIFIALNIAVFTASAAKFRKTYQKTSWSFQHPTARYSKVNIEKSLIYPLATTSMDATSDMCYARCSIFCNMIECCNVSKCDEDTKTCYVGLHLNPLDVNGGEQHMVREQKRSLGYNVVSAAEICAKADIIDGIRNKCSSDEECFKIGKPLCDADPNCFGIAWYETGLYKHLKFCRSTLMKPASVGWRTIMKKLWFEFEEMDGNGYCTDAQRTDLVARKYLVGMSHKEARKICELDEGCVAYAYSLDSYLEKNGLENVVLYTNTICSHHCGVTTWQDDPNSIKQASNDPRSAIWTTGKCYVKKSSTDYYKKCFPPS